MTDILYSIAAEYADIRPGQTLLDAYCGAGSVGLTLIGGARERAAASALSALSDGNLPNAALSKREGLKGDLPRFNLIGLEVVPEAVENARRNAVLNSAESAEFICGKCEAQIESLARRGIVPDVAVIDPPRKGCDAGLLRALSGARSGKRRIERIVYISCNPATLARDIKLMGDLGWRLEGVQGVDMFAWSHHVETVCLLSKLRADHHIEVNLNMNELDLTSAESKATYDEIKEYVLENSGLKVTNLYIAQVKEKMGIKERENYNLSKKEDAKVPKCPVDKEKAIVAALRHFNMID